MRNFEGDGVDVARALELILVALVSAGLSGLALAVMGTFKAPQAALVGLAISVAYAHVTRRRDPGARGTRVPLWQVLVLVVVAIFFRLPPANYVSGGQDQGVYVNVAAHIVHSGGITAEDRVAARLDGSSAAIVYSKENAAVNGDFLPGLFQQDPAAGGGLQFQFYHLFPVYMALAGGILGLDTSVYALTFLSILSVLFFHCLALNLSGRTSVAFWATLLLAVNPLHGFFSRFPVSEIPSLCFTLAAAWLLVRSVRLQAADEGNRQAWWDVLLSVGALGCAFLIRMNGFMYIPIILLIGFSACIYVAERSMRRLLVAWSLLANGAYAATVLYGYIYSPIYSGFHLAYAFGKYLGPHWGFWIVSAWLISLAGLATLYLAGPQDRTSIGVRRLADAGRRLFGPLVIVALAMWLYKLYVLGWTDRYALDPWLAQRWPIAQAKGGVFAYSSLVVAAEYASPLLLFVFLGLAWLRRLPGELSLLLAFVLVFFFYVVQMQWLIPYQPYYARYLVGEFVPYLILFVALAVPWISSQMLRRISVGMLVVGGFYSALLSVAQLRANEHAGLADSYERVASRVQDDDILLLDTSTLSLPYQLIEMPFMLRYYRYVARISEESLSDASYLNDLHARFDQVYLLSGNAIPPSSFLPVEVVRFREIVAEQGLSPPIRSEVRNNGLTYLHMRPGAVMLPNVWKQIGDLHGTPSNGEWWKFLAKGWSIPESWGIWSVGTSAQIKVPSTLFDGSRPVRLDLVVKPFVTATHARQRVRVMVDRETAFEVELTQPGTVSIPLGTADGDASMLHTVVFEFPNAVTPREAGMDSSDKRQLAVGLVSARVVTRALQE